MDNSDANIFYSHPILNSPYEEPARHWELDINHQPTKKILPYRRPADFITPVPKPKVRVGSSQGTLVTDATIESINTDKQEYHKALINEIRTQISEWRKNPTHITPTTAKLLNYWHSHKFNAIRPFFCQIEAVETAIWLTEVAPHYAKFKKYLTHLEESAADYNNGLFRIALKMATGSGKTTVMAMLIAWQTLNAVRSRKSSFTNGFLIVAPGITIKDRLQILKPNYPGNYYQSRELLPPDMLGDMRKAVVVVTNYHAFMLREKTEVSKGTRAAIEGWRENVLETKESPGEMIQRVMPDLARMKNIIVMNDEGHHCYMEGYGDVDDNTKGLSTEEKTEVKERSETARVWISGLEMVAKQIGISRIYDLSATPFFLAGSGYAEGTIFPWTMSDFSLMDAIECGIVKLPRIPVADNVPSIEVPMYRNLWENIRRQMPKKNSKYDPQALPAPLITALNALYGHYRETFELWQKEKLSVPPCFIIVCNNTNTSKQVYDYISGYWVTTASGIDRFQPGKCPLFSNFEEDGTALARPRTLLIDSVQLERGDILDKDFYASAKDEIERFKREAKLRGGKLAADLLHGKEVSDAVLLREVMNTVGKKGQLGEGIRCVVSVGMLSEGWDANNVTHILGIRAFGTQLLCEQVIGRALRRQSYEINPETGLFDVEYADALGIPFDFSARPDITPPPTPKEVTQVQSISPERDNLEITFPHVAGYRTELPADKLGAEFEEDSRLRLTVEMTGATNTKNSGIIGEVAELDLKNLESVRDKTVLMHLTKYLLETHFKDGDGFPQLYLFGQLKKIASDWMKGYFECADSVYPAQLLYRTFADLACERIKHAIDRFNQTHTKDKKRIVQATLDPYNPVGSTMSVNFKTTKRNLFPTEKSHVNYVVSDSGWEELFADILERNPKVISYVKNYNMGFEVPYRFAGENRTYIPDFIVKVDIGNEEIVNLIVEIKGKRDEEDKQKKLTMVNLWIPGINNNGEFGKWDFLEIRDKDFMQSEFEKAIKRLRQGLPAIDENYLGELFNVQN